MITIFNGEQIAICEIKSTMICGNIPASQIIIPAGFIDEIGGWLQFMTLPSIEIGRRVDHINWEEVKDGVNYAETRIAYCVG